MAISRAMDVEKTEQPASATSAPPTLRERRGIAPEDRIPVFQKICSGAGGMAEWLGSGLIVSVLWMPVFNIGYGISPGILGLILMAFRAWDALADPIMGNLSDNTRTRWGRRRPYLIIGAIATGLCSGLIWQVPEGLSDFWMLVWISGMGLLLFTCFTVWAMPYYSFMLELTPDYDERTRLSAYRAFFSQLSLLGGAWVLPLAASSYFADPATGEADLVHGMKTVGIGLGLVTMLVGMLPGLFVTERFYAKEAAHQEKESLWISIRETLGTGPLWLLVGIIFCKNIGNGLTQQLGAYINIYYISEGELSDAAIIEGWKYTVGVLAGLLSIPFWTWLSERYEKKVCLYLILGSGIVGSFINLVCLNPDYPYLQLIPSIFGAAITGAIWLILPSMMADIADYDELRTHRRREGSINAVFSLSIKIALTLAAGLSGYILEWTGFDVAAGKVQPEDVTQNMVALYIILPAVAFLLTLFFLKAYPLSRQRMLEIRTELEARRGKL